MSNLNTIYKLSPKLAIILGINKAIMMQRIHQSTQRNLFRLYGHSWINLTHEEWCNELPWMTAAGIQYGLRQLIKDGYVIYRKVKKTHYMTPHLYRINYTHQILLGRSDLFA